MRDKTDAQPAGAHSSWFSNEGVITTSNLGVILSEGDRSLSPESKDPIAKRIFRQIPEEEAGGRHLRSSGCVHGCYD